MVTFMHYLWRMYLQLTNRSCKIKASQLGKTLKLEDHVTLEYGSCIAAREIGRYTFINKYCLIDKSVASIGRFCSVGYGAKLGLANHPLDRISTHAFTYDRKYGFIDNNNFVVAADAPACKIGNDVWIGANAIVMAGVTVGDGAVIGANSFVNSDVEPYSIVAGSPARHIKYRFEESVIQQLNKEQWWNWEDEKLRKNLDFFHEVKFQTSD